MAPPKPGRGALRGTSMVMKLSAALGLLVILLVAEKYVSYTDRAMRGVLPTVRGRFALFSGTKRMVTVVAVAPPDLAPGASVLRVVTQAIANWTAEGDAARLVVVLPSNAAAPPDAFNSFLVKPHAVVQPCSRHEHRGKGFQCKELVSYTDLVNYGVAHVSNAATHLLLLHLAYSPQETIISDLMRPMDEDTAVHITAATLTMNVSDVETVIDHGIDIGNGWTGAAWRPFLLRSLNGFAASDARTRTTVATAAASPFAMLVRHSTWTALGGLRKLTTSVQEQIALGQTSAEFIDSQGVYLRRKALALGACVLAVQKRVSLATTFQRRNVLEDGKRVTAHAIKVVQQIDGAFDPAGLDGDAAALLGWEGADGRDGYGGLTDAELYTKLEVGTAELRKHVRKVNELQLLQGVMGLQEEGGWDLCLRVRKRGLKVVVTASRAQLNVTALPDVMRPLRRHDDGDIAALAPPSLVLNGPFEQLWGSAARTLWSETGNATVAAAATPKPPMLRVIWQSFCCHCCGFANEILHLVFPLQKYHAIDLIPAPNCFCQGYPSAVMDSLSRMHLPPERLAEETADDEVVVWVSHTDPGSYLTGDLIRKKPTYVVGRSMYEFTKIPERWVHECRDNADEIWVPSSFVRDVWIDNGVAPEKVVLIPEAVDVYFFDPEVAEKIDFPLTPSMKHYNSRAAELTAEDQIARYKFLSHFKWEDRKGWDILCSSYFGSFTADDPVTLIILTHIWFPGPPETHGDATNHTYVREAIVAYVTRALGMHEADMAHFVIITSRLSEADVAALYNSVDGFVMPTKGEGWGLPPLQAMSMGVPTATTNWSGSVDFLDPDHSFPIPPERIEDIPKDSVYGYVEGKKWAVPSVTETSRIMKYMADRANERALRALGQRARRYVVKHLSEEAVARRVSERLSEIQKIIHAKAIPHRDPKDWR